MTDKRVCRDKTLKRLATKVCLSVTKKKKKKRNSGSVATNETYKHTQFVVTKDVFCRDKHLFVATKDVFCLDNTRLSRQTACRDKIRFVATTNMCRD